MVSVLNICLLFSTIVIVIADLILALCLRFVLPRHIKENDYYPADGRKVPYEEAVKFCPCLARVFPDGTKDLITFALIDEKVLRRRRREIDDASSSSKEMNAYPFLVSLSIPAYSDDPEQKIFACNGLIQTENTLLTTKTCVKEDSEWYNLTVRSGSVYWSKYGQEHSVIGYEYVDKNLVALRVFPKFSEAAVPKPPIKYPSKKDWVHAVTVGWDDRMYEKNIKFRYKYKKFDVEEWTSRECASEGKNVCHKDEKCGGISSKPLLTSCHQLIGMKYEKDEGECDKFFNLAQDDGRRDTEKGEEKGCYKIHKDTCHVAEMDVC